MQFWLLGGRPRRFCRVNRSIGGRFRGGPLQGRLASARVFRGRHFSPTTVFYFLKFSSIDLSIAVSKSVVFPMLLEKKKHVLSGSASGQIHKQKYLQGVRAQRSLNRVVNERRDPRKLKRAKNQWKLVGEGCLIWREIVYLAKMVFPIGLRLIRRWYL